MTRPSPIRSCSIFFFNEIETTVFLILTLLNVTHPCPCNPIHASWQISWPARFFNEYYFKPFKDVLAPYLAPLINTTAEKDSLTLEMLRAHIVTPSKPGKDPNTPSNCKTISLLNSDVKLYAKILGSHFMDLMPKLVQPDQIEFH